MRALILRSGLEYCEKYPTPTPADGEAVVRVIQAGICATDLQLVQGYMGFQGVLGHEFVGIVDEAPHHPNLVGKRVVGEINAACRVCPVCQAGRLDALPAIERPWASTAGTEPLPTYLVLPAENLYPLPDEITNDQAVFTEPLAAACQILEQVSIHKADRVLVIGDGKLGLLCAQILQRAGCRLTVLGTASGKIADP